MEHILCSMLLVIIYIIMKVVEITAMHSKRNISVLNTFVFTDKDVLETRKRILRKDGFKYNRQERRFL